VLAGHVLWSPKWPSACGQVVTISVRVTPLAERGRHQISSALIGLEIRSSNCLVPGYSKLGLSLDYARAGYHPRQLGTRTPN